MRKTESLKKENMVQKRKKKQKENLVKNKRT